MSKILPRDEHGYINERGASKYWGVTTSKVDGERIWVVNFKVGGFTCGYRASGFKLKEVDAARIAAFLYESGEKTIYSSNTNVSILSADKKYVFKFNLHEAYIYREKANNQKVYQFQPNLTLPFEESAPALKAVSLGSVESFAVSQGKSLPLEEVAEVLKSLDDINVPSEREILGLVTDAVYNKTISETGARILIAILEGV